MTAIIPVRINQFSLKFTLGLILSNCEKEFARERSLLAMTPSPGPPRLKKTPLRSTLSPKEERATHPSG